MVSFDFNLIERLIAYSDAPVSSIANATNTLAFDVLDINTGLSVFGAFGTNPSSTRTLSYPITGSETYNLHTLIPGNIYPGPMVAFFQTPALLAGNYVFTIKGSTSAFVSVPEPSTYIMMGLASATVSGLGYRRRKLAAQKTAIA